MYFFNVFGPGQIQEGQYATVIGIFENQMRKKVPLTVVSPGTQTRAFTHIDDIVDGIISVARDGSGDDCHLGTDENVSILEVAEMFGVPYEMIPERRGERQKSSIMESRAKTELNWKPQKDLRSYIQDIKLRGLRLSMRRATRRFSTDSCDTLCLFKMLDSDMLRAITDIVCSSSKNTAIIPTESMNTAFIMPTNPLQRLQWT